MNTTYVLWFVKIIIKYLNQPYAVLRLLVPISNPQDSKTIKEIYLCKHVSKIQNYLITHEATPHNLKSDLHDSIG